MSKVKTSVLLLLLMASTFLFACSSTERLDGSAEKPGIDADSYSLDIDTTSIKSTIETTPSAVQDVVGGVLSIDAKVTMPPINSKAINENKIAGFTAKRTAWTPDSLLPLFFSDTLPSVREDENEEGGDAPYYTCESDEGALYCSSGFFSFGSSDFRRQKYDVPLISLDTPAQMQDTFGEEKLSVIDKDEAVKAVSDILKTLGVEPCGEAVSYSLSATKLNEVAKEARKRFSKEDFIKVTEEEYNHVYTQEDEMCIVEMHLGFDSIPITTSSYLDEKSERGYTGSSLEAWVTAEGIVSFELNENVEEPAYSDSVDSIIPLDKAISLAAKKYANVISESEIEIKEIRFEYVPVPKGDGFEDTYFTPTWYLSPGFGEELYMTSIRVDAITGDIF